MAFAERSTTPVPTVAVVPDLRSQSPSPSASPTPAISAIPHLERCASTTSSASSLSGSSSASRVSSNGDPRRRGYLRPQPTSFAESARNRESVMSLGSIAHLQYYFARTGLLDGKGAQLARPDDKSTDQKNESRRIRTPELFLTLPAPPSAAESSYNNNNNNNLRDPKIADTSHELHWGSGLVGSPVDESDATDDDWDDNEPAMLPPTVSTYNYRTKYVPPPPSPRQLRKELREAVRIARQTLQEVDPRNVPKQAEAGSDKDHAGEETNHVSPEAHSSRQSPSSPTTPQGWYEIQGVHLVDVMTLAIRAAKVYYTSHENPARLAAIKSERKIREELLAVLDVLKRMATRDFAGGIREAEIDTLQKWLSDVDRIVNLEEVQERQEVKERRNREWLDGEWQGRELEREWLFLKSFDNDPCDLPPWTPIASSNSIPTEFLAAFRDGRRLINLHNQMVRKSKRPFGEIAVFHNDTAKPYRCAENLRFWRKAAEIRWELKLEFDVMGIVLGENRDAWAAFEAAIFTWCKGVREELTIEWKTEAAERAASRPGTAQTVSGGGA
ncbi:hypothetical protein L228DRAFT_245315 [Xylona heveae TC161]|uniref:Uncharacterized protein n=1 Tax=Xylona heveae (strain CBS 132557 / TC161) TaxID=1328760 RepID=A0A165I4Y6_XYLHT|nr:hypothetical protein L228DRAFT_245315 [Xylona heveae TC161]KZF24390.1 hypothetical protein L228DRAFT_245315 [Xylona heveae TC161]